MSEFVETTLNDNLVNEALPDLSDFADEPGGPLLAGWYKAEVIEGYATRKGKQFITEDSISSKGDSRNLRVCFKITPVKGDPRNLQNSFNYRITDFTPERVSHIKELREEMKGVRGAWPDRDAQRTSLSLAKLGQFQKSVTHPMTITSVGLVAGTLVGQELDVRLSIDENGYNDISAYAPAGKFTGTVQRPNGRSNGKA